jgi:hypothetical protein
MKRQRLNQNIRIHSDILSGRDSLGGNRQKYPTNRRKHIYVDSREDVRKRGRDSTLAQGSFRVHFQETMTNVKQISIAQMTLPTSFQNMVNRDFTVTYRSVNTSGTFINEIYIVKKIKIQSFNMDLSLESLDSFGTLCKRLINTAFLSVDSGLTDLTYTPISRFTLTYNPSSGLMTLELEKEIRLGLTSTFTIEFARGTRPINDYLGMDEAITLSNDIDESNQTSFTGDRSPDTDGFNYLFVRTPNITTNAEFIKTEIDAPHKNNLLCRIPLGSMRTVATFDYSWFPTHRVEINSLDYLVFEFYFYDGTKPNFQSENISLILVIDYLD